jgi:aldehyde dehydrogenase (NAD+)
MQKEFHAALLKDLGVTEFGSVFTSILITKADIEHNIAHL